MTGMKESVKNALTVNFDEYLPFKTKLAYGLSQASSGILSGIALGSAITFYYNVKLGLSEEWISLAWLLFAIWNAINDPLFGILQERINTEMGRRIPVLRLGAPIYSLTFIICWFPFMGSTQIALFLMIISGFGFDNMKSVQTNSALFGIQLGYTLIPAVFFIISAIVLLKWYKLDGKEWIAKKQTWE